jgi:hypothetical protein
MGRLPTSSRKYEIQHMWERHFEIARLNAAGLQPTQIAAIVGVTPACVGYTLNSALVRRQVEKLRAGRDASAINIQEQIEELAPKAVALYDMILENDAEALGSAAPVHVRKQVADMVLGISGLAPVQRLKGEVTHAHLTADDIARLRDRAIGAGAVVESQVVSVETVENTNGQAQAKSA